MSPEQESFEQLRRLLALKRHEQPPPGYFNDFPKRVLAGIQAGETAADSLWERIAERAPWLGRVWEAFETKPALAGAFGVMACGLLISGVVYSERAPVGAVAVLPEPVETVDRPVEMATQAVPTPLVGEAVTVGFSSTAGAASADGCRSLFDQIRELQQPPRVSLASFQK